MPPIGSDEWALASDQRALVYSWFSGLYAAEIPNSVLKSYLSGAAAPMFAGLATLGLGNEVQRLKTAFEALRTIQGAHLELAADFAQLFLLDAKTGALPYASAHAAGDTSLYGPAEARMRAFLASASLTIQEDFKEPADHLAIYLAVMARLIADNACTEDIAATAKDQATFLHDALLVWLPAFDACNQRASPRYDVYPALSALLIALVRHDADFVRDIAAMPLPEDVS